MDILNNDKKKKSFRDFLVRGIKGKAGGTVYAVCP